MEVVGLDIGFGFTKATNGRDSLVFKSVFGESTEIQYREQLLGIADTEDHLHIEFDGNAYFVGELAERQSNVRSYTLNQDQLIGTFAKVMAMAGLSHLAQSNEPIKLVTGLPISFYRRHRNELAGILYGKHPVITVDPLGNRQETVINVNQVRVIPQPFGSLFNLMLNDAAEIVDKRFVQEKVGIIDIGFRTADYSIADRARYSERGSHTTDSGIARAFSIIANRLHEATGVNVELYRLYDAVARGTIKIHGQTIDLAPVREESCKNLAASIAAEVDRLWVDDWDTDIVVVTGGGGGVLAPQLQPLLKGEVLAVDPDVDARLNNVRGYWKYGLNLWGRDEKAVPRSRNARERAQ